MNDKVEAKNGRYKGENIINKGKENTREFRREKWVMQRKNVNNKQSK